MTYNLINLWEAFLMAIKLLSSYEANYEGGATAQCNAQTMEEAAKVLSDEIEPSIIRKTGAGVRVIVPDPALAFKTEVAADMYTAGNRAYPANGGQVKLGDTVFLSAVPVEGYRFTGWYQGDVKLSEEVEAAVVVASASNVPAVITYEARFEQTI
jgi:hypothetical protein